MEEGSEEPRFIDAEQYSGGMKEKLTFRDIVLSHLKKIGTFASVEFRGGFWEEKPHPSQHINATIKTYIPDTREVYSNSIEYLFDILYPHLDKETIDAGKKAEKERMETYKDHTVTVEPDREDQNPEDAKEWRKWTHGTEGRVSYRTERRKIMRELFRALCVFLKKKDYLKGKEFEEEI